jgi:hypothetical protein
VRRPAVRDVSGNSRIARSIMCGMPVADSRGLQTPFRPWWLELQRRATAPYSAGQTPWQRPRCPLSATLEWIKQISKKIDRSKPYSIYDWIDYANICVFYW